MSEPLDCARVEELLSDRVAGALPADVEASVDSHVASCDRCGDLVAALRDVIDALQNFPALEAPAGLAERAAEAALAVARRRPRSWMGLYLPDIGLPAGLQALAATVALAVTGTALLAVTQASRLREGTVSAGVYLTERKDRVFEDIRLLRVVVTTAFEGRLDRMNDRVDDYRRLLERRRAVEEQEKRTGEPKSDAGSVRAARHAQCPPGCWNPNHEPREVVTASDRADGGSRRPPRRES